MNDLETRIRAMVAKRVGCDVESVDPEQDFADIGLKSLDAVIISGHLEDLLGIEIDPSTMFENRTINAVASKIRELQKNAS